MSRMIRRIRRKGFDPALLRVRSNGIRILAMPESMGRRDQGRESPQSSSADFLCDCRLLSRSGDRQSHVERVEGDDQDV